MIPFTHALIDPVHSLSSLPTTGELPEPTTVALGYMLQRKDNNVSVASTSGLSSFLNEPSSVVATSTPRDDDATRSQYIASKMKYKDKAIRLSKELFLVSPSCHADTPPNL